MPANSISINLLGHDEGDTSTLGRIATWALSYGRYIMIGTEIVVLLAFISRFSLDRKLTDLKEEVGQKQAILEVNLPFEQSIRSLQDQLGKIKSLLTNQTKPIDLLEFIHTILPPDVYLDSFEYNNEKITVTATAGTTHGFSQFLANLNTSTLLTKIEIGDIKKRPLEGIQFQFSAGLNAPSKIK